MKWAPVLAFVVLAVAAHGDEWKLPVVTLRYEMAEGAEEDEEEGTLSPAYWRHSLALRVKEEQGRRFRATVVGRLSYKDYESDTAEDYWYFSVVPGLEWSIGQAFGVGTEFRVKKATFFENAGASTEKDYLDLAPRVFADWRILKSLKLDAWLRGTYSLYENRPDSRQAYSFGVGLSGRWGQWNVGARYRGTARLPLGEDSTEQLRGYHVGSVNLSWDPNR
ncbi:MAG: hypothetical protein JW820_09530 [Spirochaetales bacterium]|nr:hypothetical protein [Spirochaetales bacterium]